MKYIIEVQIDDYSLFNELKDEYYDGDTIQTIIGECGWLQQSGLELLSVRKVGKHVK